MALDPRDIALLSQLLDQALELTPAERVAWLAALPPEHQRHAEALREMLAREATLDTDDRLAAMPRLPPGDESIAHAGDRVGPYALLREIGRGGMGSVWLAARADGSFKRQVALKLPRLAWGTGLAERMAREREIGALLEHPNIARLYDAGVDERGRPYLALEYIDGQPIDAWCEAQGLSVRDRLRLFVQVARAVAYAHGRLVVHRDLKPSNVMVTPDRQAHLLDFGIAKLLTDAATPEAGLTQQQGRVLTPHYASPEQVAGEAITVQSDVYSLGVLLYELLTNTLPIAPKRSTLGAVEEAILEGDAPLASSRVKDRATAKALRGEVDAILAKAMQREPGRRYATADAMAQDIERYLNGETVAARPDSLAYRLRKSVRRNWVSLGAATVVLTTVLVGGGTALLQAQRASKSADRQRLVTEFVGEVFRVNQRTATPPADGLVGDAFLRQSAVLVSQKFQDEPAVQAQMYGVIAEMFIELGVGDQAVDYAKRQLDALATVGGGEVPFDAVLTYAHSLRLNSNSADAESQSRRALQLAGRDPARRVKALASLLRNLRNNLAEGLQVADELEAASKALGTPSIEQAWGYAMRGALLSKSNRFPESAAWHQKAVHLARQLEGKDSPAASDMMLMRGFTLLIHREGQAARDILLEAYEALRRRGGLKAVAADTSQARSWVRMFELRTVSYDEARSVVQRAVDTVAKTPALPDRTRCLAGLQRGDLSLIWGDLEEALRWMVPSAECLMARLDNPGQSFWLAREMAILLTTRGDHQAAEQWVRQRYRAREGLGETGHPWSVWDPIIDAMNLSMSGRSTEAATLLGKVKTPAEFPHRVAPIMSPSEALRVARARVLADQNQSDAAWELVQGRPHEPGQDEPDWTSIVPLYAELLCRRGQHREGRALLEQAVRVSGAERWEHAPALAWMRSMAGQCALGMGDGAGAISLARQARQAFTIQPAISPYYKAPLIQLERKLGLKLPTP